MFGSFLIMGLKGKRFAICVSKPLEINIYDNKRYIYILEIELFYFELYEGSILL